MAELLFKKGLEESLPIASERTEGVFYVTEDTKKIVLGEAVWEDTNKVKEEIYSEIIKDEKVTAAALTELKEKKQNKLIAGKNITIENDVISVDADFDSSNFKINENYQTVEYPDTENEDVVFESIEVGQELGDAINTLEKNLVTLVAATIENEEIISTTLTQFDQEKVDYQTFDNAIEELNDKISNFDGTEGLDEALSEIREEITNINNVIDTKLDIEAFSEAMASFEEDFETIDETVSNALTELHETVVDMTEIVEGKADVDHNHDDLYITEEVLESKGYITADDVEAPDLSGLATEEYVDNKVAALVNGAPETLDTLDELAAALKDNADIVTVLNDAISAKADKSELNDYSLTSHTHEEFTVIDITVANALTSLQEAVEDINTVVDELNNKADISDIPSLDGYATEEWVSGQGYLTASDIKIDVSDKQDVIEDLDEIRSGAAKGATALQSVPEEYVTEDELSGYSVTSHTHEEFTVIDQTVSNALTTLQETVDDINEIITDLDNKADKSEIPSLDGYATQSWVEDKGYITAADINVDVSDKQDVISDLDEIRSGAAKGATALQSVPEEYITETELNGKGYLTEHQDISNLATKKELSGYAESSHTHSEFITLQNNIDNKQDKINDLEAIINGAAKGATALQEVPAGYVTETELNDKGYLTEHQDISNLATKDELSGYTTDAEFTSLSEVVNTKSNEGHTHPDYAVKTELATVATTGDYNHLSNKPTIPSEVTESTVSGWGFTKTTGTYSKPNGGIPKNDLSSDVQTSLGKADTALQSVPEEYVTESELNGKNYATTSQVNSKQDTISDLESIRTNASNGATAFGWGNHANAGYVTNNSLEATLIDYVKVNDIASNDDIDGLFK